MSNESSVFEVTQGDAVGQKVTGKALLVDSAGRSLFTSSGLRISGDTYLFAGAGAPVDYTDGTPPATGEGVAGIGSIYIRTDTGKHYVNKGTKAQPLWGIVTSA